jgi:hypothetical protein
MKSVHERPIGNPAIFLQRQMKAERGYADVPPKPLNREPLNR